MSQHDYVISDQAGGPFLADLNSLLAAVVSQNSGATEPTTTYAYQFWADTSSGLLKVRNAANSAWVSLFTIASGAPSGGVTPGAITSSGLTMATARLLGRSTSGTGAVEELTLSQVLDLVGSAAQGDILYRGSAGWEKLSAGTSGQILQTNGTGANPSWVTQASSNQYEKVSTTTITAVGSITFDLQEDIYCEWKFVLDTVKPASDDRYISFQMGYGGTYLTSAGSYLATQIFSNNLTTSGANVIAGASGANNAVGNAAGEHASVILTISGLSSSSAGGFGFDYKSAWIGATGSAFASYGYGIHDAITERLFDSVRFLWNTGNFSAQGTITMYGLKR